MLGFDPDTPEGRVGIRRRLGYVPQETGFPRGFTAFGFVDYMAILKEWSDRTSRHHEVRRAVDLAGLDRRRDQTRVRPCQAGNGDEWCWPRPCWDARTCLVLDEPTAGLDPEQRARLRDVLGQRGRDGRRA